MGEFVNLAYIELHLNVGDAGNTIFWASMKHLSRIRCLKSKLSMEKFIKIIHFPISPPKLHWCKFQIRTFNLFIVLLRVQYTIKGTAIYGFLRFLIEHNNEVCYYFYWFFVLFFCYFLLVIEPNS